MENVRIRELLPCQIADFMVNPSIVTTEKKGQRKPKKKMCSDGRRRQVYFSANHVRTTRTGTISEPHPEGFQFVNMGE